MFKPLEDTDDDADNREEPGHDKYNGSLDSSDTDSTLTANKSIHFPCVGKSGSSGLSDCLA